MGLQEEAVLVPRDLQELRGLLVSGVRHNACREHHQIGLNPDFPFQKRRVDGYVQAPAVSCHCRLSVLFISQENDPLFPRFGVICLPETVGAYVSVQDIYIRVGILLLDFQGVLDRLTAAHARAVRPFLVAGTHTLDHDDGTRDATLARVAQPGFQIQLGDDLRAAISIAIFRGLVFAGARRDDHHSMLDRLDAVAVGNGCFEIADGSVDSCDSGVGK